VTLINGGTGGGDVVPPQTGAAVPTPSATVVGPDTFGAPSAPGASATYSRGDHDHGLPALPGAPAVVSQALVANVVTVASTTRSSKLTNNSAAGATITIAVAGATDGWPLLMRFYDFSGVAEALTFVNTENSTVSVPAMSNGSTTLPITIGFVFNAATSLWRCVAVA
jgi:hypothetical protein